MNAKRFFRTPKGILIVVLTALTVIAAAHEGVRLVAPGIVGAVLAAMLIDAPILRARHHQRWVFPDGALLTGLIVASVLSSREPWWITTVTAAVAVLSKYVVRSGKANVFNPAALALVATFYLFNTGQSWWGALPELPSFAVVALLASGAFVALRVNKAPAVLSFLGTYYLLVTIAAFIGDPAHVAELYRAPDLHAALYFAFFMVTDPPTSPPREREQIVFGVIVAVVSVAVFELFGVVIYLLIGLLVANAFEAWGRRMRLSGREWENSGGSRAISE